MKINTEKICQDYGNISEFCRSFNISVSAWTTLRYKKTDWFRDAKGNSFKLFKQLEKMGYILKEEKVA